MKQALYMCHLKKLHKIVWVIVQILINKDRIERKKKFYDI